MIQNLTVTVDKISLAMVASVLITALADKNTDTKLSKPFRDAVEEFLNAYDNAKEQAR